VPVAITVTQSLRGYSPPKFQNLLNFRKTCFFDFSFVLEDFFFKLSENIIGTMEHVYDKLHAIWASIDDLADIYAKFRKPDFSVFRPSRFSNQKNHQRRLPYLVANKILHIFYIGHFYPSLWEGM